MIYVMVQPGESLLRGFHCRFDFIESLRQYVSWIGMPKTLCVFVGSAPIYENLTYMQTLSSKQIKSILSLGADCGKASEGFSTSSAPAGAESASNR